MNKTTINIDLAPEYWQPLRLIGVGRELENPQALVLYLSREYTGKELRQLHETIAAVVENLESTKN